ncbi:Exocyst complex subunit Exo70, C-terminal [Dillenia turbinata]|uniref:Exocyst subunit Exo70 family protein n=1 Tax=Dillenia turbinata TaxID=194707 RepID=A0AAN8UDC3_9MAGN
MVPVPEGDDNLIAAVEHIARALGTRRNLPTGVRKILADLGTQLSTLSTVDNDEKKVTEGEDGFEERLNWVQDKIMSWEADQSMVYDSGLDEFNEYLGAADETRKLTERLESLGEHRSDEENEFLRRAHDVLQLAMARLEEEFKYILYQHRQNSEPGHMSFRSNEDDIMDERSIVSLEDESVDESIQRDSVSKGAEEYVIDLVHPDVVPYLKYIANLMFDSNYDHECSQAFVSVRKDALDECLSNLEVEKLSIEDVLKLDWVTWNCKIKRWIWAIKIFVRVYLTSEMGLAKQIFGDLGSFHSAYFVEAAKSSILRLLNFGGAIAIGPYQPEKLSRILQMYEVLDDLVPDFDTLFSDEAGSSVRTECHEVLKGLGDCVKATFIEFGNAIASNASTVPFAGGGVHHLTRYVMNYVKILGDYREILGLLLNDHACDIPGSSSPNANILAEEESKNADKSCIPSVAPHFHKITSILESNLDDKSKLYRDPSLQHIFLMNNIHYMAEKVKNSELRTIFGDEWIRKHNWKFQQHEINYERSTWSSILSLLRDDGLYSPPGSSNISKTLLKDRFRSFSLAFEEVYKTQTAWVIPDAPLREDLRISTSLKVVQAYRTFVGRHTNHIIDKHIKYSADDLQNYLLDLFEGSPKSLSNPHRR